MKRFAAGTLGVGFVALGWALSIGVVSIGVNAVGWIAVGLNAAGFVSVGLINSVGAAVFVLLASSSRACARGPRRSRPRPSRRRHRAAK